MTKNIVSVIMPVYNGSKYVTQAIESILKQTFLDFEFIIIDDCSSDNTVSVVRKYQDERIKLICNKKNVGLAKVRNIGLKNAKGKYIAWIDSDDISEVTRIEKQVTYLENNKDIGVCGTWVKTIGAVNCKWRFPKNPEDIKSSMLFHNCLATSSVMMRTEVLIKNSCFFDSNYLLSEDYDLWDRLSSICKISNIPEVLTYYRIHSSQITYSNDSSTQAWEVQKRNLESIGIFPSHKEKLAHLKIGLESNYKLKSTEEFQFVIEWLDKIYEKNIEFKKYSSKSLRNKIDSILYAICSQSGIFVPYIIKNRFSEFGWKHIYRSTKLVIKHVLVNYCFMVFYRR